MPRRNHREVGEIAAQESGLLWAAKCQVRTLCLAGRFGTIPVREMAIDYVRGGGSISQHNETRENYRDFAFYYKVTLPIVGFSRGVFVELRLIDEDPDNPTVLIVSAHRQGV